MGARWILAIDLGNGGPKVAVVSLEGEVRRTAMRPVHVCVGLDGAATQNATEWWDELRAAAREAIVGAGADSDQLHAIAITGQWASSVPVGADNEPVGDVLLWSDTRARDLTRAVIGGPVTISGFAPRKVLPFIRLTGGATFQVVIDPKKADAIFTDRIGTGFEKSLQDLVAPPKAKDDGKLASADFTQATSQSFSRGKGSLFLVDRQSHVVVWSIYAKPKNNESEELNRLAAKIADQLGKDRAAKK